jgi:hypothetical protein
VSSTLSARSSIDAVTQLHISIKAGLDDCSSAILSMMMSFRCCESFLPSRMASRIPLARVSAMVDVYRVHISRTMASFIGKYWYTVAMGILASRAISRMETFSYPRVAKRLSAVLSTVSKRAWLRSCRGIRFISVLFSTSSICSSSSSFHWFKDQGKTCLLFRYRPYTIYVLRKGKWEVVFAESSIYSSTCDGHRLEKRMFNCWPGVRNDSLTKCD